MIALLVITDGRDDYLAKTIASAREHLIDESVTELWMYDDTGDEAYQRSLMDEYPDFMHMSAGSRLGFGGAIQSVWRHLVEHSEAELIFHLEQDFTFNRPVPLAAMRCVLRSRPYLVQLALRRQAWSDHEVVAGGVIEQHPDAYEDVIDDHWHEWLEHTLFFTTNPSLYRRSLCELGWPDGRSSEGVFTHDLRRGGTPEEPDGGRIRFGYWGARTTSPWVTHIGAERRGTGY